MRFTRARSIASIVTASLMLVACGTAGASQQAAPATSVGATPNATLRVIQTQTPANLDPHSTSIEKFSFLDQLFNTLITLEPGGAVKPALAVSWTYNATHTQMTVHLRPGVKFSNGKPLTAQDVVFNIDRIQKPLTKSQLLLLAQGDKATAVGSNTVVLNFPNAGASNEAIDLLAGLYIVYPASNSSIARQPIGTGPFAIASYSPGQDLRLKKNPYYWQAGLPYLANVDIRFLSDSAAMVSNLEAGQADLIRLPPDNQVATLKNKGFNVITANAGTVYDLLFNVSAPPFNNLLVREAVNEAINRKSLVTLGLFGVGGAQCDMFAQGGPAYSATLDGSCPYDPAKAKQLLAQAGYPKGFSTTIDLSTAQFPADGAFAQIIQSELAKIGVDAKINNMQTAEWLHTLLGGTWPGLMLHVYANANLDPALVFTTFPFSPTTGVTHFRSAYYTKAVAEAAGQTNNSKRTALYKVIAKFVHDQVFTEPLASEYQVVATASSVHGFRFDIYGRDEYAHVQLSKP